MTSYDSLVVGRYIIDQRSNVACFAPIESDLMDSHSSPEIEKQCTMPQDVADMTDVVYPLANLYLFGGWRNWGSSELAALRKSN